GGQAAQVPAHVPRVRARAREQDRPAAAPRLRPRALPREPRRRAPRRRPHPRQRQNGRGGRRMAGLAAARGRVIDELLARRTAANERFFAAEAERIALLCRSLAERFERGGRLLACGGSAQAWSDARHVAVEFVHPVIVGKRALPALALAPDEAPRLAGDDDILV